MSKIFVLIVLVLFMSCGLTIRHNKQQGIGNPTKAKKVFNPKFQTILDSAKVKGGILVYDLQNDRYYSNDFDWAVEGKLPASTFKIVNSIVALETGVVNNDSTIFKWNGEKRAVEMWEQNLAFKDAFQFSCVPCYQEIAREIGVERMNKYLKKLQYGNMDVSSENIDLFWLEGESKISQFQQLDFLKRFYFSELGISERTKRIVKRILEFEQSEKYKISAKTGWSIRNGTNNGWFVGYVEKKDDVYFFAVNIEPMEQFNMKMFSKIRIDICYKALKELGIICGE